jgi:transcriptional regulator with XRE-family HTH domain
MSTRTFTINGKKMRFSCQAFKTVFDTYRRKNAATKSKTEQELADKIGVGSDTIHGWYYGKNGPSSLEDIKKLAAALGLHDDSLLLESTDGGENMSQLTQEQIHSVKKIYDASIEFLDTFWHTDGFNDYWYPLQEKGYKNPEQKIYEMAMSEWRKVSLVLDKEYFYLRNTQIYDILSEYVSEDLLDTFDTKLGYAYRFEAVVDGNPTTSEDYDKARIKLNNIIEQYL